MKKYGAEFFGTFWLVLGGCGSAVLAAAFPDVGIGLLGVSLAFGLTVLTMAFAIGHISGCHLNPAVSIGLWAGGRFPAKELVPYIVSQVLGRHRRGRRSLRHRERRGRLRPRPAASPRTATASIRPAGIRCSRPSSARVVMTMMFLLVILGATDKRAPQGFAPIAIGLCLTLIHLISIPVTNTSVNPGAQHRRGALRRRLGDRPAVAVLGGPDRRRAPRRGGVPVRRRGGEVNAT